MKVKKLKAGAERGGTLVEAAVTVMLLFLFILGILEFGRAFDIYQILTNAAREGARFAVAPCSFTATTCTPGTLPTATAIQDRVNLFLASGNVQGATVTVDQSVATTVNGVPLVYTNVSVSAPYTFVFFPFGKKTMSAQAKMRNETNQ